MVFLNTFQPLYILLAMYLLLNNIHLILIKLQVLYTIMFQFHVLVFLSEEKKLLLNQSQLFLVIINLDLSIYSKVLNLYVKFFLNVNVLLLLIIISCNFLFILHLVVFTNFLDTFLNHKACTQKPKKVIISMDDI